VALVCTLIVTFTEPLPGTTCGGEKDTVDPAGKPDALKSTTPVNAPDCPATFIAKFATFPEATVWVVDPDGAIEKSGMDATVVDCACDALARKLASPP
jgi:hypothetical protein